VTLFFGGWLRPFSNIAALDFLKYGPVAGALGAAAFVQWLGRKSPVTGERRFFAGLAVLLLAIAMLLLASPVVLNAVQGVFWFFAKVLVFLYAFIWYRGTFPRYRYDQLMNVGWRWMIPLALANLIVTAVVLYFVNLHAPSG
jgi:NADH-quinone oxidoreductase subunit H